MNPNQTTRAASVLTKMSSLYAGDGLPDLLQMIDDLHSAVSDGELPKFTTLHPDDIAGLLEELVYVAQETLRELNEKQSATPMRTQRQQSAPVLRLLPRDSNPEQRQA